MRELKAEGYTVLRMAGSHGFADLVAVRSDGKIRFIQCKPDDYPEYKTKILLEKYKIFNHSVFNHVESTQPL